MKMKKYKTLSALYKDVQSGKIDESELTIVLDNDWTGWYLGEDDGENDNSVGDGEGYYDVRELYELLFPKAEVMHV